jgi:hypothetical protein
VTYLDPPALADRQKREQFGYGSGVGRMYDGIEYRDSARTSLRIWRNTPAFRFGTA